MRHFLHLQFYKQKKSDTLSRYPIYFKICYRMLTENFVFLRFEMLFLLPFSALNSSIKIITQK